tara:strand:- start:521 stop:1195 length:675 start_codon:yes stop_codon:yes gene_type:complete
MKLSEYTVSVLKNFSSINPSVLFQPGQVIKTVSPQKTVMASAAVEENFPVEGAVYDLPRFLGVLSLFEEPDLIFHDNLVEVREGRKAINYTFADKQMIIAPPEKDIQFPTPEVELDIAWSEFNGVMRASSVLGLPEIAVEAKDGEINLTALDSKNPTADTYGSAIGESAEEYRFVFRVENLKLMNLDYRVAISDKGIAKFNSINSNGPAMEYYIATEVNSTFIS